MQGRDLGGLAVLGYVGQHHVLHVDRLFGTGLICVKVEFLVNEEEKALLAETLAREHLDLFCSQSEMRFGMIGSDPEF